MSFDDADHSIPQAVTFSLGFILSHPFLYFEVRHSISCGTFF